MKILLIPFLLLCTVICNAQSASGYWYGQADVEMEGIHNNYLTEMVIEQKGNKIRAFFGYYFKDVYQSFFVKGTYDPATREVVIPDIPIIYYNTNSTINSVDCITSFYGKLINSRVKSTLTGYFYRDKKYTYTCPDIRVSYTLFKQEDGTDSVFKDAMATKMFWKPRGEDYIAAAKPINAPSLPALARDTNGQSTNMSMPRLATPDITKVNTDSLAITNSFMKRKPVLSKELKVISDSVRLSFYDNAEVDGDSISVFLNNRLVLSHQQLSERAINIYVKLDSTQETNDISMYAENLGKYPPNTALMVVTDGVNRYEVYMTSDFKGNGTIRLRRVKS